MFSQLLLTSVLFRLAVADNLSLWLGPACTGADEGYTDPLPLGKCIEFNQAQSFILKKDDGNVYNLYGGGGCAEYVGQVSLGGTCQDIGDTATAIMNIGPQDGKRWIRGANAPGERAARASIDGSSVELSKRVEGDTYQCPNVPSGADYFFAVQLSSSATRAATFPDEDTHIRNDFDSAFHAAYQNASRPATVSSYTPLEGDIPDVQVTLTMQQGVIQDIQDQDIDSLMSSLNQFRGAQSSPLNFLISLYTGKVGHPDAGIIATWHWNGLRPPPPT
ncbi:hypothetical protein GGX14DRAFT_402136 [Mycena pura]|uniref:Uncharacterized protein n=1 Tax=Mycena pura TaxID=153505 RepID=A0AAD6UZ94_9AGAR|nr:hypothetical protein GGX14DRAFT_402136 [Mycena pura]